MIKIHNVKSLYSALYKTVKFCEENGGDTIEIIVPDKLSLFMEKFLFEHMNIMASFNIKVSTLNRFAKKTCVIEKEKQISKVGSILLIHKILNENFDRLEVLKNKAYSFSYAEDIFKTIGQLKASKINFDEMKKFDSTDIRLSGKIKDLALVYEQYETQKAGLLDSSDMFLMSTFSVANGKENRKIWFVGFDDFTAIEYSIIERLAIVADVNVVNYTSKENNKHIFCNEVFTQLKNIAYINELPFGVEDCFIDNSELKLFLENNFYAFNDNKFCLKDEIVKIYSGNTSRDEIEFVAREIRTKIINGERFGDFGVAVFGLENHINEIKEIFEKYEINYYLDTEISLNKSVLFKFFVSVLKYNLDGYALANMIDLINSPFLALDAEEKRKIIQKFIAINFRGKITNNLNIDLEDETKQKLIEFFEKLTFDKDVLSCELVNKFKNLIQEMNVEEILRNLSEVDVDSKMLFSKSTETVINLLDDILKFNSDINASDLLDIFMHIAGVVKINNLPLSIDCVKVVDANNSMEIFNSLYLVGATHENAPNVKQDCGIILDAEIEKLNFSHKLSPTISHINKLSKLRLFNSVMLFENELVITYSHSQSDIVAEFLKRIQVENECGVENIIPIRRFDYDCYVAMSKWDFVEFLTKYDKNNEKINENILKNKDFSKITNESLNIFDDFKMVSATTLENYFKCPFYAFLQNVLKIKPRLETEILSLDIGNVLHEIMFKYYKLKKQVGDIYEFCKREVFRCVEREERLKLNIDSPVLTNLIDEAVRVINAVDYIDSNSKFEPKYFEFDFSGNNSLKLNNIAIVGKVDRVDVFEDMFRIIDYKSGKAEASLKELFYGNKLQLFLYSCAMERVLKKRGVGSFYLPLHNAYTKELENTYSLKGFYLAEDFVVRAFDKRLEAGCKSDIVNVKLNKSNGVTRTIGYKELNVNELKTLKDYAINVSENAVNEIKSGYIAPNPSGVSKPCEFCPYGHICMRNSCGIEYRDVNKINLDSFKEVNDESV